jgi:hypothetical protein
MCVPAVRMTTPDGNQENLWCRMYDKGDCDVCLVTARKVNRMTSGLSNTTVKAERQNAFNTRAVMTGIELLSHTRTPPMLFVSVASFASP